MFPVFTCVWCVCRVLFSLCMSIYIIVTCVSAVCSVQPMKSVAIQVSPEIDLERKKCQDFLPKSWHFSIQMASLHTNVILCSLCLECLWLVLCSLSSMCWWVLCFLCLWSVWWVFLCWEIGCICGVFCNVCAYPQCFMCLVSSVWDQCVHGVLRVPSVWWVLCDHSVLCVVGVLCLWCSLYVWGVSVELAVCVSCFWCVYMHAVLCVPWV